MDDIILLDESIRNIQKKFFDGIVKGKTFGDNANDCFGIIWWNCYHRISLTIDRSVVPPYPTDADASERYRRETEQKIKELNNQFTDTVFNGLLYQNLFTAIETACREVENHCFEMIKQGKFRIPTSRVTRVIVVKTK